VAAKLRIFVDGKVPRNLDELDDLNRALNDLAAVHGVEMAKVDIQFHATSKTFSAFWPTDTVLPTNG
jgi:hypothetical protein